jgi:hypothetical protein
VKRALIFIGIFLLGNVFLPKAYAAITCGAAFTDTDGKKYNTLCVSADANLRGNMVGKPMTSYTGCAASDICWSGSLVNSKPTTSGTCGVDVYVDSSGKQFATYCSPTQIGGSQIPFTGCGGIDTCWTDAMPGLQFGGTCGVTQYVAANGDRYNTFCSARPVVGAGPVVSSVTTGDVQLPSTYKCNTLTWSCFYNSATRVGNGQIPFSGEAYNFCKQVPDGKQRDACLACIVGKGGAAKGGATDEQPTHIYTAVGCIQTSNEGLVRDLVRLLMGVSGTVALLSILGGAFMLSISQGDTNKVKQGRELIMAAVGGLVFMIFSIIILQFVGVSLLHIPGLSQ